MVWVVSRDDRSSKLATPALKAYNKVADKDQRALQARGQPLGEDFTIVKVRTYFLTYIGFQRFREPALFGNPPEPPDCSTGIQRTCLIRQPTRTTGRWSGDSENLPYLATPSNHRTVER